jgi:hypothetical protein
MKGLGCDRARRAVARVVAVCKGGANRTEAWIG